MRNLLIIGDGGHSRVILDTVSDKYDKIGFLINYENKDKHEKYDFFYEDDVDFEILKKLFDEVFIAIGNNKIRYKKTNIMMSMGFKIATIIHPDSYVSKTAKIGVGSFVGAKAVINANATIGRNCIINTASVIEHDAVIGDNVHISPNSSVAGTVQIGNFSWLGIGCSVINNVKIGRNVVVGAGSSIINDVPDNVLMAGVPATIKKVYI